MTTLVLDGSTMQSEADLHQQIGNHPETPDFYGRNLDAMFDVLVGHYKSPVDVTWKHADIARSALGARFDRVLDVFGDAAKEWHMLGGRLGMQLK